MKRVLLSVLALTLWWSPLGAQEWLTPWLWTGLVALFGAPCVCLLGTPEDVALGLLKFREAGVSQFILSGWPTGEEMTCFGRDVLPLVRAAEPSSLAKTDAAGLVK